MTLQLVESTIHKEGNLFIETNRNKLKELDYIDFS